MKTANQSAAEQPLGISWQLNPLLGWGVYGLNLTLQLLQKPDWNPVLLVPPAPPALTNPVHRFSLTPLLSQQQQFQQILAQNPGKKISCNFPILYALGNDFQSSIPQITATKRIGVVFLENTQLTPEALTRAKSYDLIIAGSNWNAQLLQAQGITQALAIPQGINPTIFHPAPKSGLFADRFVVFSGGKLEYRKGQDIAIAAFKQFHSRHPEALLMVAWHNFWTQFIAGIEKAGYVVGQPQVSQDKRLQIVPWLVENGIPSHGVIDLGLTPNQLMGQILREADVAVFPNRAEGGTNLVAMEAMACGVPTILSANTGHLDLIDAAHCYSLTHQQAVQPTEQFPGVTGWGESDVDEVVEMLEKVYQERHLAQRKGMAAANFMQGWTWEKQVEKLVVAIGGVGDELTT